MKIGSLVKHIEYEYIGILILQNVSVPNNWRVHWADGSFSCWYSECELEVLCK